MTFSIAICNNIPDRLRGRLRLNMFEPNANIFIGNLNKNQRENIFKLIENFREDGNCFFIYQFKNTQGYLFKVFGEHVKREMILYDNIPLIKIKN